MAIAALKLHARTIRAAADRFHVNRVIEFDRVGVPAIATDGSEFRMAAVKSVDIPRKMLCRRLKLRKIRVTLRTSLVARSRDVDSTAMLRMTRRTFDRTGVHCCSL